MPVVRALYPQAIRAIGASALATSRHTGIFELTVTHPGWQYYGGIKTQDWYYFAPSFVPLSIILVPSIDSTMYEDKVL